MYDNTNFYLLDKNLIRKLNSNNHNTSRFSRVLRCLVYHGMEDTAFSLLTFVENSEYVTASYINNKSLWRRNFEDAVLKMK